MAIVPSFYVGTSNVSINRYPVSTLAYVDRIAKADATFPLDDSDPYIVGSCKVGDYGYFVGEFYEDPDTAEWNQIAVQKVNLRTFTYVSTLVIETAALGDYAGAIGICASPDGAYLYIHAYAAPGFDWGVVVHKVRVSDFTLIATCDLSTTYYEPNYRQTTDGNHVASDGTYVYVYGGTIGGDEGKVIRIQASDMTFVDELDLMAELDAAAYRACAFVILDGHLYAGTVAAASGDPARVVKIDLSTFAFVSSVEVDDGAATYPADECVESLCTDGTYLYALNTGEYGLPLVAAKIDPADMSIVAAEQVAADGLNAYPQSGVVIGSTLYVLGYDADSAYWYKIDTSDLSVLDEVDADSGHGFEYVFANVLLADYGTESARRRFIQIIT